MRISDWSSDVCSSDLQIAAVAIALALRPITAPAYRAGTFCAARVQTVQQGTEHVELLRIRMLGQIVATRIRPEYFLRAMLRLIDQATEFLWSFKIDHD